jgi:pimeloyl-ACP methyl ester carboxylesterase
MSFLNVNGAKLYYEEQGTGAETIVFGHGVLWSCRMFDAQVSALKDRYRCVAFDFRGHGRSEVTSDGYDMDTLAEDAAALIRQLYCAPCHYLGFSMGGFVGLRLAIRLHELLNSLILVDSACDPEPEENIPKFKLLCLIARWFGPRLIANSAMPTSFSQDFLTDPARADLRKEWHQHFLNNDRIGATRGVAGIMSRKAVCDSLGEIHVPTLILVGENDTAIIPERSERMHDLIPNSRLVIIPNSGHMSTVEAPEAVNAAMNDFLGSIG